MSASLPGCTFFIPKYVFFKNVTSKKIFSQKNSPRIAVADTSERRKRTILYIIKKDVVLHTIKKDVFLRSRFEIADLCYTKYVIDLQSNI